MKRSSGILLPIFSLPQSFGIGTFGSEAYNFVDYLEETKQKYWELLPLGPTSPISGNSPYSSLSSFAGNPYYIDLDILMSWELLEEEDYIHLDFGENLKKVNYDLIDENKTKVLYIAYDNFLNKGDMHDFLDFTERNQFWLDDYALYMAIREQKGLNWADWPDELKSRDESALNDFLGEYNREIDYFKFVQYIFYKQYKNLKEYANKKGIKIIGDLPIYVPYDSSDCWANSEIFQLDGEYMPINVSGVPPDGYSVDGQLWNHPLYDWDKLASDRYKFWVERVRLNNNLFDLVRLDHFIGFIHYYSIPRGARSAKFGSWIKGPGKDLFDVLHEEIEDLNIMVEDLGIVTSKVVDLKEELGYPGVKSIQFGFDKNTSNENLPHKYESNSIVFSSTHDSDTLVGWMNNLNDDIRSYVYDYFNVTDGYWSIIKGAMATVCDVSIFSFQDIYGLDNSARINIPGIAKGQWEWRVDFDYNIVNVKDKLRHYTWLYGRIEEEKTDELV